MEKPDRIRPQKFVAVLLVVACLGCQTGDNQDTAPHVYRVPPQVDDGWETAHIDDLGVHAAPLLAMMDEFLNARSHEVHSVLLAKGGKLVFEEYFSGYAFGPPGNRWRGDYLDFNRDTLHCLHSATKSFASAMVGIAVDMGHIRNVEQKIFSFYPEYDHLRTPDKDKIKLDHVLKMSSGLEWNERDVELTASTNDLSNLIRSQDPIGFILGKPVVHEPGITWYYSGGDTNLAGDIVRKASGINIDLLSRQHLFGPLGITNFHWLYFPNHTEAVYCSGDLYLRPRDMAKFGQLFLDRGVWNGQRIISEEWIAESTREHVSLIGVPTTNSNNENGYGYQWWLNDYQVHDRSVHSYSARGWGGQQIIVFPELTAVAVFTGGEYFQLPPVHDLVREYILPALL
jgi:CubicO group peptidase (beta-lactamase class C family)